MVENAMSERNAPAALAAAVSRSHLIIVAWFMWTLLTAAALALFVAAIPALYSERSAPPEAVQAGLVQLQFSVGSYATAYTLIQTGFALVCLTVAAVIVWRRRDDGMALFTSLLLVLLATTNHPNMRALTELYPILSIPATLGVFLAFAASILFLFLFPDGRFVPRRLLIPVSASMMVLLLAWLLPDSSLAEPSSLAGVLAVVGYGTGVVAQGYRYRCISGPVQRQQARWLVFGAGAAVATLLVLALATFLFPPLTQPGVPALAWDVVAYTAATLAGLLIPLCVAAAILRHRLWDIDLIINRTLIYGALTISVSGLYILVVGGLGVLLQGRGSLVLSLLATGLVAVVFAPLRERLQRSVNRLMYGEREDPYHVLARLSQRLEAALAPDDVFPTVVQTLREALKLPYAAIELRAERQSEVVAAGMPVPRPLHLPLVYHGEPVGELILGPRAGEECFVPADRRLLEDLARQIGVAVHAVRLTADLRRSRERLVAAREEERRRLRRDLHDGLGPALAGLTLKIETARNRLVHLDPAADGLFADLVSRTQDAVADIRRLVYALRPPALDELGLAGALGEVAAQYQSGELRMSVEAPCPLPALPAAVEVAAYRIGQEALANVVRHAAAHTCVLRLDMDRTALCLEIVDDGRGFPAELRAGVGLASMRERAAELGGSCAIESVSSGGTRVRARLPLPNTSTDGAPPTTEAPPGTGTYLTASRGEA